MTSVWCTFTRVGFHCWPMAAEVLPNRVYLADRHRHLFHVRVEVPVMHDERDVEFHELRDYAETWWPSDGELGALSCETIARQVADYVLGKWLLPWIQVMVSEDGEAGAVVRIEK